MKSKAFHAVDKAMYRNMYNIIDNVRGPAIKGILDNARYHATGDAINRYCVEAVSFPSLRDVIPKEPERLSA